MVPDFEKTLFNFIDLSFIENFISFKNFKFSPLQSILNKFQNISFVSYQILRYNPTGEIDAEFPLYRQVFKQFWTAKLVSSTLEMEDELLFMSVCLNILAALGYDTIMIKGKICKNLKTTLLNAGS